MEMSYCLNLTGVNLNHSDASRNELLPERVGKASHCGFRSTVDASTRIRFTAGNTANVDDVSPTTLVSLLVDGQDSLGHVDQASDIGSDHNIDIFWFDVRGLRNTLDEATASVRLTYLLRVKVFLLVTHALLTKTSIS